MPKQLSNSLPFFIAFSLWINSLSFLGFTGYEDRTIFKSVSVLIVLICLLAVIASKRALSKPFVPLLFIVGSFFFSLFLSQFLNDPADALTPLMRTIVSIAFTFLIILLSSSELFQIIKYYVMLSVIVALIGISLILTDNSLGEKVPVIGLNSTKSVVFEQNVFGIAIYLSLLIVLKFNSSLFTKTTIILAILSSYYRTVIVLSILRFVLNIRVAVVILLVSGWAILVFSDELTNIFKFEQVSSLTGRDVLWAIGIDGFLESPLYGLGEAAIPSYSNVILHREPAFTTLHNVVVDLMFSGGLISFLLYTLLLLYICYILGIKNIILLAFVLMPSMLNTFYVFSFNLLGGITAVLIVYLSKKRFTDCR